MSNNGNHQTPNKAYAKTPKVFVPKTHDHQNPSATTLSISLRQSLPPKPRAAEFSFVNYLPQDEAVAAGLGTDQGALDPIESQRVVDLLNQALSRLLKMSPKEFWREVASDTSLHEFLDCFLRFRSRWYDLPHHEPKEMVAGAIVGELELSRRVFMILYRISSNRDPGARATDSLSPKDHGVLLQGSKLLDLPKLLDICAIYGRENEGLTRVLVKNALSSQPWIRDNLPSVISQFLIIVNTMHQRFSTLEVIFSSGSQDHGSTRLYIDMLEVMDFINDAIVSMDAFINAYEPAALFFLFPVEMRDGNEELLCTLAMLHDSLIPSLQKAFHKISPSGQDTMVSNIGVGMNLLAMRIIKFGWNLFNFCYLSDEAFEGDLMPAATKMFPANVEDPYIRTDILIQTFREISAVSITSQENYNRRTLLQNIDKYFHIISKMQDLQSKGWMFMDDEQLEYVSGIFVSSTGTTVKKLPSLQNPMPTNKVGMDEDAVVMESKISQIKDLFPDFGKGFLAACLEAYNQNPEEVIQKILDGSLHEDLQSLNTSLELMPRPKASPTVMKNDKGKGKLVDSEPMVSMAGQSAKQNEGPSVSSSSPLVGRFVRKARGDGPDSNTLDDRKAKDQAKIAALSSQYEYDDEYDDSFDDLGLSVAESGVEVSEILGSRMSSSSNRGKHWEREEGGEAPPQNPSNSAKWGSRKKPQYYVKDGKNYSYKVEGSVAVANASEASLVNQAQVELIHGLGRGGNHPLGAVKQLMEATEQKDKPPHQERVNTWGRGRRGGAAQPNDNHENQPQIGGASESSQVGENSGGPSRGRGRRGGGGGRHSNYRKDRAAAKHFSGLGGI